MSCLSGIAAMHFKSELPFDKNHHANVFEKKPPKLLLVVTKGAFRRRDDFCGKGRRCCERLGCVIRLAAHLCSRRSRSSTTAVARLRRRVGGQARPGPPLMPFLEAFCNRLRPRIRQHDLFRGGRELVEDILNHRHQKSSIEFFRMVSSFLWVCSFALPCLFVQLTLSSRSCWDRTHRTSGRFRMFSRRGVGCVIRQPRVRLRRRLLPRSSTPVGIRLRNDRRRTNFSALILPYPIASTKLFGPSRRGPGVRGLEARDECNIWGTRSIFYIFSSLFRFSWDGSKNVVFNLLSAFSFHKTIFILCHFNKLYQKLSQNMLLFPRNSLLFSFDTFHFIFSILFLIFRRFRSFSPKHFIIPPKYSFSPLFDCIDRIDEVERVTRNPKEKKKMDNNITPRQQGCPCSRP